LIEQLAAAFGLHSLGQVTGAFHALLAGDQQQLGAIGRHGRLALGGGVVRHDQDHLVTHDRRGHGQGDTGIARGRLDQGVAWPDLPALFGAADHRQRRSVLDRTGRVVALELEQQGIAGVAAQALQAHQRRIADAIGDSEVLHGHGVFAIRRSAGGLSYRQTPLTHITQSEVGIARGYKGVGQQD
jgi:hypothetical protein